MTDLSDDDLMALYRDGTPEAFGLLFARWSTPVYNFARMIIGNAALAEDIMQETFLAVARAAHDYEQRGRFRSWLMRITRNKCLNRAESERVRKETMAAWSSHSAALTTSEPGPVERMELDEGMASVQGAISRLPVRQREAIIAVRHGTNELPGDRPGTGGTREHGEDAHLPRARNVGADTQRRQGGWHRCGVT